MRLLEALLSSEEAWLASQLSGQYEPVDVIAARSRVVPTHGSVPTEWILPHDDVRAILISKASLHVADCVCRLEQVRYPTLRNSIRCTIGIGPRRTMVCTCPPPNGLRAARSAIRPSRRVTRRTQSATS